jgi:hypothetical protein
MFVAYFLVGAMVLYLGWQVLRWFVEADPKQLIRGGQWVLAGIGGMVALWLIVTGKAADAFLLMSSLAPFFVRWKGLWTRMRNAGGPTPGGSSDVETAWLRMSLDHDSGAMEGVILQGAFRGRRLGELSADELRDLLVASRADGDTATLLETYLDRRHPDWRQSSATGAPSSTPSAAMTREEAWSILGLEAGADEPAIREAHRRLMKKLHPDQGGSTYLAAKINQAKDLLLGE